MAIQMNYLQNFLHIFNNGTNNCNKNIFDWFVCDGAQVCVE